MKKGLYLLLKSLLSTFQKKSCLKLKKIFKQSTRSKHRDSSISTKIIKFVAFLIIISMIITSSVIYKLISNNMVQKEKNNMKIITEQLYENFNNMIKIQMNEIMTLSVDNDIVSYLKSESALGNNLTRNENSSLYIKLIRQMKNNPDYEHIFITNAKGLVVCDSNENYINYNFGRNDYVVQALDGNANMSSVYVSPESGDPVITVVAPVTNNFGKVIGTIGKNIYPSYFSRGFKDFSFLNSGHVFIVDNNNQYIYHPDKHIINKKNEIKSIDDLVKKSNLFDEKNASFINYLSNKNEYTARYVSIPELKTVLVLAVLDKDINHDALLTGIIILISTFIMVIIIIIVLNIKIRAILSPLKQLMKYSEEISKGNLKEDVQIDGHGEIGNLSISFKKMSENIKELLIKISIIIGELNTISEVLHANQRNSSINMEKLNQSSSVIMKDNEEINNSIHSSSESFKNILLKTEIIETQSREIKNKTNGMKEIYQNGIATINELSEVSKESVKCIYSANESFNELMLNLSEISNITSSVSNISRQTHILSLNTAIEAARAGSAGGGFVVVAEQMKKLSAEVSNHMNSINKIINFIQSNISRTKNNLNNVNLSSEKEVIVIKEAVENYNKILTLSDDLSSYITLVNDSISSLNNENNNVNSLLDCVKELSNSYYNSSEEISVIIAAQFDDSKELVKLTSELEKITSELNDKINTFTVK